jgi:hypothetical protein
MGVKEIGTVETTGLKVGIQQEGFWKRMKQYLGTLI